MRRARLPCRLRALAIVLTSTTLFFGAIALEAESLLACVTAGLIAANRRRAPSQRGCQGPGRSGTRGFGHRPGFDHALVATASVPCTHQAAPWLRNMRRPDIRPLSHRQCYWPNVNARPM